jgi:hypothetical protein
MQRKSILKKRIKKRNREMYNLDPKEGHEDVPILSVSVCGIRQQ